MRHSHNRGPYFPIDHRFQDEADWAESTVIPLVAIDTHNNQEDRDLLLATPPDDSDCVSREIFGL